MPELPEVEVICQGVRPHLIGRTITAIYHSGKKLRLSVPVLAMRAELPGCRIVEVSRRAKYIQITFDSGVVIIIHFGMTGNLGFFSPSTKLAKHDHVCWTLDNGSELRFHDVRRFGSIQLVPNTHTSTIETTIFKTTGPEPFSDFFSGEYLQGLASNKQVSVKVFIMTNQVVAGIGNIYASESLFRAGINPARKVQTLKLRDWTQLVIEIRNVLRHAIECGGSTISDFVNAGQKKGYFQMQFTVYGKQGEMCSTCGTEIQKVLLGGRASYYCHQCQK